MGAAEVDVTPEGPRPDDPIPGASLWGLVGLLFLLILSTHARATTALEHARFDAQRPHALLKSDPALLFYLTERLVEHGGAPPPDWRADPRVQWPEVTDVPAEFTVGQEFLVAWGHLAIGGDQPLHVSAVWLMALVASLAAAGVYGAVFWRTRSHGWALVAAAFWCALPASYRTVGFVLVREDLSLPLFALHLALLARAAQVRSARAFLWAGLAAGAACATWHAMGFVLALELGVLHLWVLRGGTSPFELRGAWAVLVGPVLAATLVPALRASGFLLGLPMQLAFALLVVGALRARGRLAGRRASLWVALETWAVLLVLAWWLSPERGSYAHVFEVLLAKLRFLGQRPEDPGALSFDARLLWQGPFETLPPAHLWAWIGLGGWLVAAASIVLGLWGARRGRALGGFEWLVLGLIVVSLPVAWTVGRTVVLLGLLLPLAATLPARATGGRPRRLLLGGFALATLFVAGSLRTALGRWELGWYDPPGARGQAELLEFLDRTLEPSEPVVSDFVTSTAILAHTGNPIVLQPKYETERSRRRAQELFELLFAATPDELRRHLLEVAGSRTLVLDRELVPLMAWTAGVRGELPETCAARRLLAAPDEVAGFRRLAIDGDATSAAARYAVFRVD